MNKFEQVTPQAPPPSYSDRSFLHDTKAGVIVPALQSVITGTMVSVVIGVILFAFDVHIFTVLRWMVITLPLVSLTMWLSLHRRWWNLTKLEYFLGDLNGDHIIGPPKPQPVSYTINTFDRETKHMTGQAKYTFTTASDEQITNFCIKTRTLGKPISRLQWTPLENGFSNEQWRPFYSELVTQKLVTIVKNKNILTSEGEIWADEVIAKSDPHYSPTDDVYPEDGK